MLAASHGAGLDLVVTARLLGALFGVATIVATWRLARLTASGGHPLLHLLAPLMVAFSPSFALWMTAGLETPLFAFTTTALLCATMANRRQSSAVLAVLAVLTRPEGLLLAAIVCAYWVWEDRGVTTPAASVRLGLVVGACACLFIARFVYFGDWLPNTYYVKAGGGLAAWRRGVDYALDYARDNGGLAVVFGPPVFAALIGSHRQWLAAASSAGLWIATIQAGGDGLPLHRFAVAQLPAMAALTTSVFCYLHSGVIEPRPPFRARLMTAAALLLALAPSFLTPASARYSLYVFQKRVELPRWVAVGRWLKTHAGRDESVAAVPIGAVSFFSGLTTIDMLGLTDRHIAHLTMAGMGRGWAGHEKHDGAYVLALRPTYLLLGNIDVTSKPRDPSARPFIPVRNAAIRSRERDILDHPELEALYAPASAQIAPGAFLNYYRLRSTAAP